MDNRTTHTLAEILGQTSAWRATLDEVSAKDRHIRDLVRKDALREVIFTGCGSTYYLSLAAAAVFQAMTGLRAQGLPASELLLFPRSHLTEEEQTLLVAVSRSGETTETLRAVHAFRQRRNGDVLVITCDETSRLAANGSVTLVARQAKDKSIAQTRSFTSMLLAAHALAAVTARRSDYLEQLGSLPALGQKLIASQQGLARRVGEDLGLDKFFFLGSGPNYGLACEAMLKMKEMSLSSSEAFHFAEFRHGPMSMVDGQTLVVGLMSDSAAEFEVKVLQQMKELGARLLAFSDNEPLMASIGADYPVCLCSGISEYVRGALYLPVLQLVAYYRAIQKGLDPDRPKHLTYAVKL